MRTSGKDASVLFHDCEEGLNSHEQDWGIGM